MLDANREIDSPRDLRRDASGLLRQLREAGEAVVLTINGEAELIVRDPASHRKLMEIAERAEELESLRVAVEEMKAGRGRPVEAMLIEMESILADAKAKKAR